MSITSKSPRKVALAALRVAQGQLSDFGHPNSPHTYTRPQLLACLVLKTFFRTDYRGIVAILADTPSLCQALGLRRLPHFTTLQKASARLLRSAVARRLLHGAVAADPGHDGHVERAAIDSTGLESRHVSQHFLWRRSKNASASKKATYKRFPKLGIVCDCDTHMILSTMTARGPTPDYRQLRPTLLPAVRDVTITTLLADAGYDSEANHAFCRDELGIETIIPAEYPRPVGKPPNGRYRRLMFEAFDADRYGQRWQVETVFSMIKRNLGSAVHARSYWPQCREMDLLAITHNIMILRQTGLFYRALEKPCLAWA